ncbi:MAG: TetR/AcrR family transcriptional regulator [Sphingopyxis sp.]|nr:TetR/AcrR family transcriptional regulator [Sphingopyxis sp.]
MPSRSVPSPATPPQRGEARAAIIAAAHQLVKRQGYAATSVDDICRMAGVTKGAFFHHFASKEALAIAAAEGWTARAAPLFDLPPSAQLADPLDRLLGHIDFRASMIGGEAEDYTCFVGTMVQEAHASSPAIRAASGASITAYAERLAEDIAAAIDTYGIADGVTAISLAYHIQAVLQGAFVIAKAKSDPEAARDSITHVKRYVSILFAKGAD